MLGNNYNTVLMREIHGSGSSKKRCGQGFLWQSLFGFHLQGTLLTSLERHGGGGLVTSNLALMTSH